MGIIGLQKKQKPPIIAWFGQNFTNKSKFNVVPTLAGLACDLCVSSLDSSLKTLPQ